MGAQHTHISKYMSLVLRHKPEEAGLHLDAQGWADVGALLAGLAAAGMEVDLPLLHQVVHSNDKQRFAFSNDGTRIRAVQGHSVAVDLGLAPAQPPATLYHGTADRFLASIREHGLRPGSRQHVHLSADTATAHRVGQRHGRPVVLTVDAAAMLRDGRTFYLADNGVWLTDTVPTLYLHFPDNREH